jgi:hypothetical protein
MYASADLLRWQPDSRLADRQAAVPALHDLLIRTRLG